MKAVVVNAPGGLEALRVQNVATPVAGAGEVLIKVEFAACNWGDIQKRQGIYPDPVTYPAILGAEGAGEITMLGAGVDGLHKGQKVLFISGTAMLGAFAEYVSVPQALVIPVDAAGDDLRRLSVLPVAALTAYHLVYTAYPLKAGQQLLVHSVAGGVGLMVAAWARRIGARVYGTVGDRAKVQAALDAGVARVIVRPDEDFVAVLREATHGKGVDLVIDSLGADVLERSFEVLRYYGHLINIGEAAGDPEFDIRKTLYRRSTAMAGFEVMHALQLPAAWQQGLQALRDGIRRGDIQMPIDSVFGIDKIADAQAYMASGKSSGKILIEISD